MSEVDFLRDYIKQLEAGLDSSLAMNKAQAERQKPWVGLTDEELWKIFDESDDGSSPCGVCGACEKCKIEVTIARTIEAKLKEKNCG